MPRSSSPGPALDLETDQGERFALTRFGASFAGWVYRCADPPGFIRLLPLPEDAGEVRADAAPLAHRNDIRDWVDRPPRRGAAPVVAVAQGTAGGVHYYFLGYGAAAGRPWSTRWTARTLWRA